MQFKVPTSNVDTQLIMQMKLTVAQKHWLYSIRKNNLKKLQTPLNHNLYCSKTATNQKYNWCPVTS